MIRFATLCLCLSASGCFFDSDPVSDDIVGPFTGARTRFVADSMILPMNNADSRMFASDLNGDRTPDNQLGQVVATLLQQDAGEQHIEDRIAAGELQLVVELQADDLWNDSAAGVWVYGFDDIDARPTGGEIVDGAFIPNFVRDTALENTGSAQLPMPIIADAATSRMDVPFMQISLVPDGSGGYDAQIHGAVRDGTSTATQAIVQQLREHPEQHRWMWMFMDENHDGNVTPREIEDNALLRSLLAPDIRLGDEELLSVGIAFHLTPCPSGNCAISTPEDSCHDRVRDGDEVDVDCGGSCGPCGVDLACVDDGDCQSGMCANNVCTAPTCFDGIKNGFEASADCGGACAKNCEVGQVCGLDIDCQFRCSASYSGGTGVCQRGP
ncbi:MAG: hypothetical protein AB7L94_10295 [Kofleriaceae bacterium]